MEERDSLRTMLYGLARFGLFWLINIFALIIGKTAILGIVGTFVPKLALYDNPETLSFLSWLIPSGSSPGFSGTTPKDIPPTGFTIPRR